MSLRIDLKRIDLRVAGFLENPWIDAGVEFVTVFVLSNVPFVFLVFGHFISTKGADVSWSAALDVVRTHWKPGEILIFVSALLGPFCFVMYQYHRARRHMPGYWFFLVALLFLYPGAAYIFATDRLGGIRNEEFVRTSAA